MAKKFEENSYLYSGNAVFVEELFQKFLQDPASVDSSWSSFFENEPYFQKAKTTAEVLEGPKLKQEFKKTDKSFGTVSENSLKAKFMIAAYRERGHYIASLDPLGLEVKKQRNN